MSTSAPRALATAVNETSQQKPKNLKQFKIYRWVRVQHSGVHVVLH